MQFFFKITFIQFSVTKYIQSLNGHANTSFISVKFQFSAIFLNNLYSVFSFPAAKFWGKKNYFQYLKQIKKKTISIPEIKCWTCLYSKYPAQYIRCEKIEFCLINKA